jgi:hypothetical protein
MDQLSERRDRYYKDRPAGMNLMSGLPLPKAADGKVHGIQFVRCTFHPNCSPERYPTMYIDCTFTNCDY